MDEDTELERIRHALRLARRQVDQGNPKPDLAQEYLRQIKEPIERYPGTIESAEYSLLLAEALIVEHSPAARSFLEEAEQKITTLPGGAPELEVRLYDRLAYFSEKVLRKRGDARDQLKLATAAAVRLGIGELTAHMQLRVIRLDLKIDDSPEVENFRRLRRVGCQHNFTDDEQLMAWYQHCGETGPVYARGIQERTEQYFLDLLRSVRVLQ